jgi:hypothetical protein
MSEPTESKTEMIAPAEVAARINTDAPRAAENPAAGAGAEKPDGFAGVAEAQTAPAEKTAAATAAAGGRDSLGRLFDPEKFRLEKDTLGRWKNRRGGRKRKGETAAAAAPAPAAVWTPEERAAAQAPGNGAQAVEGGPEAQTAAAMPEVATPPGARRAAALAGTVKAAAVLGTTITLAVAAPGIAVPVIALLLLGGIAWRRGA